MSELAGSDTLALSAANVLLGALVVGAALAVLLAAVRDVLERRRMRGPLPDAWPPTIDGDD